MHIRVSKQPMIHKCSCGRCEMMDTYVFMECVCCQNVFEVVSNNGAIIMSNTSDNSGSVLVSSSSYCCEKENKMS